MEGEPDYKNRITRIGQLPRRTIKKLEQSKEINVYSKRGHEEAVWQEKKESTRTEGWRQYMAGSQKYPFKAIFKEIGPKEIQTF